MIDWFNELYRIIKAISYGGNSKRLTAQLITALDETLTPGGGVTLPITLNPGDVLAQDAEGNELIEFGDDGGSHDYVVKSDDLSGYWSVRQADSTPAGPTDAINVHENGTIELVALDGFTASPIGKDLQITTGYGFDDGENTPQKGGDVTIQLGGGVNGGRPGVVYIQSVLKLAPTDIVPDPPEEGMVYANSNDHHLYYYNGTTWKQLDN